MTLSIEVIPTKIVCLNLTTRGLSYAVMHSALELEETNMYAPKQYNANRILTLAREIIEIHKPLTLVLENTNNKHCRKGARSKQMIRAIALYAKKEGIYIEYISRIQVRNVFERWGGHSKYEISEVLSRNIKKLKPFMFKKPKYPSREPNAQSIFSAVSMGVSYYFLND